MQANLLAPAFAYMWDHLVSGRPLFPGAALFEMAAAAARVLLGSATDSVALAGASIPSPLVLPELSAQARGATMTALSCRLDASTTAIEISSSQRSVHLLASLAAVAKCDLSLCGSDAVALAAPAAAMLCPLQPTSAGSASFTADVCDAMQHARNVALSPAVLDSCLHLGAVPPVAGTPSMLKVPAGVQAICILVAASTSATTQFVALACHRLTTNALSITDFRLSLAAGSGNGCCDISGLEAKSLMARPAHQHMESEQLLYKVSWEVHTAAAVVTTAALATARLASAAGGAVLLACHALQLLTSDRMSSHTGLLLATTAVQPIATLPTSSSALSAAVLWGMARAVALEAPALHIAGTDADVLAAGSVVAGSSMLAVVPAATVKSSDAFGQATRSRLSYHAMIKPAPASSTSILPSWPLGAINASIGRLLITGGMGTLGSLVATWMAGVGMASVLQLVGRSGKFAGVSPLLQQLLQSADGPAITFTAADMACMEDNGVLTAASSSSALLAAIIHSGGVLADATLPNQRPSSVRAVFASKLAATERCRPILALQPAAAEVLFSSVAALLGSAGQANYSAANAALDAAAQAMQTQGLAARSIQWGAWAGGGMASHDRSTARRVERMGMGMVAPAVGLGAMARVLFSPCTTAAVFAAVPFRWQQFVTWLSSSTVPPMFAVVAMGATLPSQPTAAALAPPACTVMAAPVPLQLNAEALQQQLAAEVQAVAQSILGAEVSPTEPLMAAGMDSLSSVEFRNSLVRGCVWGLNGLAQQAGLGMSA